MPLRRGTPVTFTGRGLSDSIDATNSAKGAMRSLVNLVPDPRTRGTWVCRPGQVGLTTFPTIPDPGFVSGLEPVGNIAYGMIASSSIPGKDEPFAYDLANDAFLTIAGVLAANVPNSPPSTGEWTPPVIKRVGSRIIVTHPGFTNPDFKFGWFDVSGFMSVIEVDLVNGQPFLYGGYSLLGVQPGMAVTGSVLLQNGTTVVDIYPNTQSVNNITATSHGTNILDGISGPDANETMPGKTITGPGIQPGTIILRGPATTITISKPTTSSVVGGRFKVAGNVPPQDAYTADFTAGNRAATNLSITTDLHTGQLLNGVNIIPGTYIESISGTTMNMTQAAIATLTASPFLASGVVIEISLPPVGDTTGPVAIAGGTEDSPQWGAGDTAINHLPSAPLGVGQMNGRAWFADGPDGIPYSDSLLACVRTNATQALTVNNAQPVTAIAEQMLTAALTGGIVQSLIAFQGTAALQQIMGDPATGNLTMNLLPVPTGTNAANTLVNAKDGLFFMSPEGLRFIDQAGHLSDPVGLDGDGVVFPFLQVTNPPHLGPAPASRMSAAANGQTLRIDVPQTDGTTASYWYDLTRHIWTGPHTGAASLVKRWSNTFVVTPADGTAQLLRADDTQHPDSLYIENGRPLDWEWESCLLPDNASFAMNTIIESTIMVALPPAQSVQIDFLDETRVNLDGVAIVGFVIEPSLSSPWGGPIFTGPDTGVIRQRLIPWTTPLTFKQGSINVRGVSDPGIVVGNFYIHDLIAGYALEVPQIPAATPTDLFWLLSDDGVTILRNDGPVNLRPG